MTFKCENTYKYENFSTDCTNNSQEWKKIDQFEGKDTKITHSGIEYKIVSKEIKQISFFQKVRRIVICTLTLDYYKYPIEQESMVFAAAIPNKTAEEMIDEVWHPKKQDKANEKMWKNSVKAIKEHSQEGYVSASTGVSGRLLDLIKNWLERIGIHSLPSDKALPSLESLKAAKSGTPLTLSHTAAGDIGPRSTMEDAHFYKEISQGTLCGVFDGHGGKLVADYASNAFAKRFEQSLNDSKGNVRKAFERLFTQIQIEIVKSPEFNTMGSTAVVTFFDKKTNIIYTATLGDSEANIYRKINGKMISIPLSCVRDWSSKKDAARAAKALNKPQLANIWPKEKEAKSLRFPSPFVGINVSRAFGDLNFGYLHSGQGMIHKPKITMNQLSKGDVVVIACDGLKDYVPEKEIIEQIKSKKEDASVDLAKHLVNYAVNAKKARDNVSVIAIKVGN